MEVRLTPEQEARLTRAANQVGQPIEALLTDAAIGMLQTQERFLHAVEKGIAAADRGEFIEEDEMNARVENILRS